MGQLKGKTAIVTGASSGIGYEIATLFAMQGANVVVTARREDKLTGLVSKIRSKGGNAIAVSGDVCEESFAKRIVQAALDEYGSLDIAVNNAGTMGQLDEVSQMTLDNWHSVMTTNVTSAFLGAKYQLPAMLRKSRDKEHASLIFTSSFVGNTVGMPGMSAYGASKAAMVGLMKSIASEYGPRGIRSNALLPGATDTEMADEFANTPEIKDFVRSLTALKRTAKVHEMAQSALYLASSSSSFMTGHAMFVDGGVSITRT